MDDIMQGKIDGAFPMNKVYALLQSYRLGIKSEISDNSYRFSNHGDYDSYTEINVSYISKHRVSKTYSSIFYSSIKWRKKSDLIPFEKKLQTYSSSEEHPLSRCISYDGCQILERRKV
jgi:hypothetical protein